MVIRRHLPYRLSNVGLRRSSTQQADGSDSDCMLKLAIYPDGARHNGFLIMSEVMLLHGNPHPSNARATIADDDTFWVGLEQEYFLYQDGKPLGWPTEGYPNPQGEYYIKVGFVQCWDIARQIVEEHLDLCIEGINHEEINAEVLKDNGNSKSLVKAQKMQASSSCGTLHFHVEQYGVDVNFHCKPFTGDWNYSGMQLQSSDFMRETGGKDYFESLWTNSQNKR